MKKQTNLISQNLTALRQYHKYSQEEVAEKVGVTRQAVAKWEAGETVPDIINCDALADLYDVSVDALIHHDQKESFSFGYNGIPCKLERYYPLPHLRRPHDPVEALKTCQIISTL
ncbi:MAG: helix-turn-helix transcriptional regulator [Clostridiales bacterium]|nr:helix-turn-helix transcriptional regulator [Clostridiales bacterium]